ncbi:CBS domain-containing protein [Streptomyces broussonetiae]|uniref:CBS domain-containing protein n=1 Tax=Streptomyces broussonetiae TaxID=2686304 RepID=A0ABV5EIV8_9ACTN
MKATSIGALMVRDVVTAGPGTPLEDAVDLFREHRVSGLPVVDGDDRVIGVISERDLVLRRSRTGTVGEVMSVPAVTVRADAPVPEAARLLAEHEVKRLPVVDDEDRLVGIVTRRELLQVFLRTDEHIRHQIRRRVFTDTLVVDPGAVDITVRDGVVTLTGRLERRSDVRVAIGMTTRLDGVVTVLDQLSYRVDDSRPRPAEEAALHGVTDGWLRGA